MYVIDSQTAKDKCSQNKFIKFETERIKASLWGYSDTFILVTRNIRVNGGNDIHAGFENCALFSTSKTGINDVLINEANYI